MISLVTEQDVAEIKKIHSLFFKGEFEVSDFLDPHTLRAMCVRNNDGNIVCAGGVRLITEAIMITDKDFPPDERREAFLEILEAMMFTCGEYKFNQLHAFIQDEKWMRHLKSVGFKDTVGKSVVLCF